MFQRGPFRVEVFLRHTHEKRAGLLQPVLNLEADRVPRLDYPVIQPDAQPFASSDAQRERGQSSCLWNCSSRKCHTRTSYSSPSTFASAFYRDMLSLAYTARMDTSFRD